MTLPINSHHAGEQETSDRTRLVEKPLVSVLMLAYNHGAYLVQAIESVVSQECDFPFELVIGEDCSTDDTKAIALGYQKSYPAIVRIIHSESNVGMNANFRRIFAKARGEFVAHCEGDDYWCNERKLADQAGILLGDAGIGVVHSDWVRAKNKDGAWEIDWAKTMHRGIPRPLLEGHIFGNFHYPKILRTCTAMHRRSALADCLSSPLAAKEYRFVDTVLTAYLTSRWRVGYLPAVTAVYRESPGSVLRSGKQAQLRFLMSCLEFDTDARQFFAQRSDYPTGYRLEHSVALCVKALALGDFSLARSTLGDIRRHFGVIEFIRAVVDSVKLRAGIR